jgi:hypothetical protein
MDLVVLFFRHVIVVFPVSESMYRLSRASDLTSTGLGKHHTSPKKARSKRNSRIVIPLGNSTKHRQLLQKLAHLRGTGTTKHAPTVLDVHPSDWEDITDQPDHTVEAPPTVATPCLSDNSTAKQSAGASLRLHTSWADILPGLVSPLLKYITSSVGSVMSPVNDIQSKCTLSCVSNYTTILCLYFNRA